MTISVNGQSLELPEGLSVQQLLDLRGLTQGRVAVEVNRELIARSAWNRQHLQDGDRVEIVSFVGGG